MYMCTEQENRKSANKILQMSDEQIFKNLSE